MRFTTLLVQCKKESAARPILGLRAVHMLANLLVGLQLCNVPNCVCGDERKESSDRDHDPGTMWVVQLAADSSGATERLNCRILAEAQDGGLLVEERSGRIRALKPEQHVMRQELPNTYTRFDGPELAADLLRLTGDGFQTVTTEHFVICSNAAPAYADYCGKLLELVYTQFHEFFRGNPDFQPTTPTGPLPVLIFATREEFDRFAAAQHPETSFADTTGYYSVRDNQILLLDLTAEPGMKSVSAVRKKLAGMPRQVATIVHEAVHQLTYNCGLQVRMADNPLWISEGLAVWFEAVSGGSALLWNRPGLVNPVHQPAFVKLSEDDSLPIRLDDLISGNQHFGDPEHVAAAYAESWGLVHYLIREDRAAFDRLLTSASRRKPLVAVGAAERVDEFRQATGKSPDEIQTLVIPLIRKLRVR